jgi:hypothetical protein
MERVQVNVVASSVGPPNEIDHSYIGLFNLTTSYV